MKKQAIAAAVAVALGGGALSAQANTSGLTGVWTGTYVFSMTSPGGGGVGVPAPPQAWSWDFDAGTVSISNTTTFFGSVWTAHDTTFSDNGTDYGSTPAGVNMLFDWSASTNIPVTIAWDVTATGNAASDTGAVTVVYSTITPASGDFPGFHPAFNGSLTKVPVPAAVWLMGSGLVGLVGVARRRRKS